MLFVVRRCVVSSEFTLRPDGEVDMARAQELRPGWLAAVDEHRPDRLVIDLSAVTFIDSGGLSLLVVLNRRQIERGGTTLLANPAPIVRRVLAITALDQVMEVTAPEDEPS
jgi:anti-sigma B factor antagonist